MIHKKLNLLLLLIFFTAHASETIGFWSKYRYYIYAISAFSAATVIAIPIYLKSREETFNGTKIFEKSTKEALYNFKMSGNLYPILSIEDSVIPNILHEYEKYPKKDIALFKSFLQFKDKAQNYKYTLHQNNPITIKKIRTVNSSLPADINELIGEEIKNFLLNPKLNSATKRKIEMCEKKLAKEINE